MKVVIVGGVAGGATAAARIRRLDERAQIVIFERSGYISYANCGLPYYIGGEIAEKEALTLQTPASFFKRFNIDVRVRHEVTKINPDSKTVAVTNLDTGACFEESYDKLVLAPGAKPVKPALDGIDGERVFTLRTVEDTFKIREFVDARAPRRAVLIGGGFIGLEMAENLQARGIEVTIVERAEQLMAPFDADMAAFIHAKLRKAGIKLLLSSAVSGFEERDGRLYVAIDGGAPVCADMAVMAIGVTPDTQLARNAQLELGARGGIVVNAQMQTSKKDIYAVGDAVLVKHFVTGAEALISLAGPANKQARIAADNICGIESRYDGAQGSSVLKLFDMTIAATGINERAARAAGIDCDKVFLSPASHASYYPGGSVMTMKVVFEKGTWRLLGAQIIGYDGVDKRIDVIATAMRAKMTAPELAQLDLAYAPPYSSAKDPVNMAGFMIENLRDGILKQFFFEDIERIRRDEQAVILDVRTDAEFARGHIDGVMHIPVDELRARMGELDISKRMYVICQSGLRSYIACRILTQHGFDCYNFSGGFRLYETIALERDAARQAFDCGMEKQ